MTTATIIKDVNSMVEKSNEADVKKSGRLTLVFIVCFLATFFSGIIGMLMSVYLPVVVKELSGNVSEEKMNDVSALINCIFIFGWMFGGIVWGIICDKIGRSASVALSIGCFGLFAVLTGLSSSWMLVLICRFLSGFGIGGILVTTTVLVAELWSGKMKAVVLGIVSVAMPIGFFTAGAINNFTEDWRTAFWIGAAPVVLSVLAFFTLPESDKWKSDKSSIKDNSSRQLFTSGYGKNLLIGAVVFGTMLIGLWAIFSWAPTWVQSISKDTDVQQQRGITMMILAGGGIAGSFLSGWIVNSIGIRKTMLSCFAVCFIMTFVVFKLNAVISFATFAEMTLLAFFFGISQGALSVYIPSLFPVSICASATGFCFNVGRLFTGTVVFFIGALVSLLGGYGNAVFTFSFIFILGFIATWIAGEKAIIQPVTSSEQ
jgi:MFS family permease